MSLINVMEYERKDKFDKKKIEGCGDKRKTCLCEFLEKSYPSNGVVSLTMRLPRLSLFSLHPFNTNGTNLFLLPNQDGDTETFSDERTETKDPGI